MRKLSKIPLIIIVIAFITVASIAIFLSFNQNNAPQKKLDNDYQESIKANITSFSITQVGTPVEGGIGIEFFAMFNATVQNFGEKELDGLNIVIQKTTGDNNSQYYNYNYVNSSFSLKSGEAAQIRVNLETDYGNLEQIFNNKENFQATLYWEGKALDQRKLY